MISIGCLIKQRVEASGMTVKEFSQRLGILRPNVYRIFSAQSIDTNLLMQISVVLNHNFFEYYATDFRECHAKKTTNANV
ncbi:MAG: helix-turn-helix domain-containing protein [Bacteroidaceae bacterium]|nr:helix-turn-helix domain-containing protein [Bacteroidaceae bacterium]